MAAEVVLESEVKASTADADANDNADNDYAVGDHTINQDISNCTSNESTESNVNARIGAIEKEVERAIAAEKGNQLKLSRCTTLEIALKLYKMHLSVTDEQELRAYIMQRIVECNIELDALKDELADSAKRAATQRAVAFKGHRFSLQFATGRNPYCEVCLSTIWRVIQQYRRCENCGFRVHGKCIERIQRECVGTVVSQMDFRPQTDICEEIGLDEQEYMCAECKHPIEFDNASGNAEPRLCNYNGKFYCYRCHWNDEWIIPARVVHNWNFDKYKVCRSSKQLLSIIERRPFFDISQLNPKLLNYVDVLTRITKLRKNIMLMKCYFVCCKTARKQRILQYLSHRQHFVEDAHTFSLADLRDLHEGRLLTEIEGIVQQFTKHIVIDCPACIGKGFICELCNNPEFTDNFKVIYPFDDDVSICENCLATFHKICFGIKSKRCPRCLRRKKRQSLSIMDFGAV